MDAFRKDKFIVNHEGHDYVVIALGAQRTNAEGRGEVYAHLASLTEGRQQRNGWNPTQMADWLPLEAVQPLPGEEKP